MKPNEDEVRGEIDKAKGKAKEVIGRMKGDPNLEQEGVDQKNSGDVQAGVGRARRKVGEAVNDLGKKIGR